MKKHLPAISIALALPMVAIAQTYNYAINQLNIPCLEEKGDAVASIGWGRGNPFQALELQAVYSPMPHLAVMANYFGAREKEVRKMSERGTDYYLWEAAIGAYEKLPNGSASLFAGFGNGKLFSFYVDEHTAKLSMRRWFLQPGFAYRSKHFQAGLALRLTRLNYAKGEVSYSDEVTDLQAIQRIEKKSPLFLPELGLQAGMRLKPATVNLSISTIFPDTESYNFVRLNTSLSLSFDFGVGRKQKN